MSQFLDPDIPASGLGAGQDVRIRPPDMAVVSRSDDMAADGDASKHFRVSRLTTVSMGLFSAVEAHRLVQLCVLRNPR
jgi:hypothetical protein